MVFQFSPERAAWFVPYIDRSPLQGLVVFVFYPRADALGLNSSALRASLLFEQPRGNDENGIRSYPLGTIPRRKPWYQKNIDASGCYNFISREAAFGFSPGRSPEE